MSDSTRDRGSSRVTRWSSSIEQRRDDSIVRCWDALIEDNPDAAAAASPGSVAVIQQLRARDDVMHPDAAFLDHLEHELGIRARAIADVTPPSPTQLPNLEPRVLPPSSASVIDWGNGPSARKGRRVSFSPRWVSMRAAAAVLAVLLVASLVVLYLAVPRSSEPPVIPAATVPEPVLETVVQFDFEPPLWGMPDATSWNYINFNLFQIDPGKSFSTDIEFYTWVGGPLLLMVASGELTIHPAGPAFFYPADRGDEPPVEIPAGETVSLGPNDAIVYASMDSATGSNPGSEPAVALLGNIGNLGQLGLGSDSGPIDIKSLDSQHDYGMDALPTAGASISVQRLQLVPFDSFVFDPGADWTYLCVFDQFQMTGMQMADGAVDGLSPDIDTQRLYTSTQLTYPDPGPHTLFNLGDKTVDIYLLVVEPASDAATPTP